jgi:hypothetical protein
LRAFRDQADKADWALIYFAGHGIEINRVNYLVPVDAKLLDDRDVKTETVSYEELLDAAGGARTLRVPSQATQWTRPRAGLHAQQQSCESAKVVAALASLLSFDLNCSRLGFLDLRKRQREYPVAQLRSDFANVNLARKPEASRIMTHVIFGVERLKIVVFGEVQAPSHAENAFLDGDIDVRFLDTGHLKNDLQSILRFENVGCRQVCPS